MSEVRDVKYMPRKNSGKCQCPTCKAINQFRSDFTYAVGEWVLGLRCKKCSYGAGQQVVELAT